MPELSLERRELLRRSLVLGGALAAGPVFWKQPGHAAAPPAGGHLAFGADPTREMTVSWATPERVAGASLDLGLSARYGMSIKPQSLAVAGTKTVYHHVRLSKLRPDTTYHYRVRHRGSASADHTFRTAPAVNRPFRFTAFGDQGVNAAAETLTARLLGLKPAFHVHVGDLCYANPTGTGETGETDQAVWDRWFAQNTGQAARAPWMPTVGNHEMEPGYGETGYAGFNARFQLPRNGVSGAANTYWFRYGNVAVIALDGNDASYEIGHNYGWLGPRQDAWLEKTLAAIRADRRIDFVVVGFHNCMYCSNAVHASDGGNRNRWEPLFDKYAVDVVVNGHNHCYERTHPMRAGAIVDQGTVYITAGGGGQAAYPVTLHPLSYVTEENGLRIPEIADWSAIRDFSSSVLVADVTPRTGSRPATMRLRAVTGAGAVIDDITLQAGAAAALASRQDETRTPVTR